MKRALPILAAVVLALSTAACQNMPWSQEKSGSSGQQTGAATSSGTTATTEQQALAPDMVRDIQRRLSQRGYDAGPADGIYGDSTQSAMKSFQKDQKLRASGQLDEQTLAALGVGRTAGGAQRSEAPGDYTPMNRR